MVAAIKKLYRGPAGIGELVKVALPVFLSQAIDTVMIFTDRYFLAELGRAHLGATMAAGLAIFLVAMFLLGTLGQVTAFVAQYLGSRQKEKCSKVVEQGLLISVAVSLPIMLLAYFIAEDAFSLAGHKGELLQRELEYFNILILTVFTLSIRATLVGFFTGLGHTGIVLLANFMGVVLNIPLSYAMIFGQWGMPAMGIEGAAWATVISGLLPMTIFFVIYYAKRYHDEFNTRRLPRFDKEMFKRVLRFGVPSGIEITMNMSAFTIFMLVVQSLNDNVAAAVTIVLNWDIVSALPMFGLGQGAMSLVGRYKGAKKMQLAKRVGRSAIIVALVYSTFITVLYLSTTSTLTGMFSSIDPGVDYSAVYPLADTMLRLSCFYIVFDAFFIVFSSFIRGAGDTRWAMITSNSIEWSFTIITVYLIKAGYLDAITSWGALIALVFALAVAFFGRYLSGKWQQVQMIE